MRHVEIYLNVTLGHAFLNYTEGDEMRCAWRGYLDLPDDDAQACAIAWAYFQNPVGTMVESIQDQAWIERSQELTRGYNDRSLSAGDVVTIDDRSYAAQFIGWAEVKPLTGAPIVGPEGDERLREQVDAYNAAKPRCPACGGPLAVDAEANKITCEDRTTCGFKQEGEGVRTYLANATHLEGDGDDE